MAVNTSKWEALIFVYNADAGLFSLVSDFAHKILSPETYACNLCKLTYGNFTVKKEWKEFIENLGCDKIFLHRDEFQQKYPGFDQEQLPAVFGLRNGAVSAVLGADELNRQVDLRSLKAILMTKLA